LVGPAAADSGPATTGAGCGPVVLEPVPQRAADRLGADAHAPTPPVAADLDQDRGVRHAPLRLAHPDWLHHRLLVAGPAADLATFRQAAAGAGTIPWQLDLDRMEEDLFHLLVAPPPRAGALTAPSRPGRSRAGGDPLPLSDPSRTRPKRHRTGSIIT